MFNSTNVAVTSKNVRKTVSIAG